MKIIISILFISVLIPCSCMEPPVPEDAYNDADFVFAGKVISIITNNNYYYEIVKLSEPKLLFGQADRQFEISARCRRARKGLFDAT